MRSNLSRPYGASGLTQLDISHVVSVESLISALAKENFAGKSIAYRAPRGTRQVPDWSPLAFVDLPRTLGPVGIAAFFS